MGISQTKAPAATKTPDVSIVWFGAGISLAEILAGTEFASLGFAGGMAAIVLGHVIGGLLFLLAGLISARTGKGAMEAAGLSFGAKGAALFAFLNVVQLVGWIAILNRDGAVAASGLLNLDVNVWCIAIGLLIALWVALGMSRMKLVNRVAILLLLSLTAFICTSFALGGRADAGLAAGVPAITFGGAVELAVAMPLSWLPLIGDYTARAERPARAAVCSTLAYTASSMWMYAIGMMMALLAGTTDIAQVVLSAGLGIAGLLVVVFSTVTTNFVAATSGGVSFQAMLRPFGANASATAAGIGVALLGAVGAVVLPLESITGFLYLIGSVFTPMIAILVADRLILKRPYAEKPFCLRNLALWVAGFAIYRVFLGIETPLGSTLPSMLAVVALCVAAEALARRLRER